MKKPSKRLSREEWLHQALELFAKEGKVKLRIDSLVKGIGVTKGSFYWHFKDRKDFIVSLSKYWVDYSTLQIVNIVNQQRSDAKKLLFVLMKAVFEKEVGRYDLTMRAWAASNPEVARIVRKSDEQRIATVSKLFHEMGFRGKELKGRTDAFFCYMAGSHINKIKSKEEELQHLKWKHAFFTRP
jgi:AcrR family transcriptional regulator